MGSHERTAAERLCVRLISGFRDEVSEMLFSMYFTYKLPFRVPTVCPNDSPAPLSHICVVLSKIFNLKPSPFFLNILPYLLIRFWKSFLNTVLKQPLNILNWIKIWGVC